MTELVLEIPTRPSNIAIVAGEFNHFIVQQLVDGAFDALGRNTGGCLVISVSECFRPGGQG